MIIFLTIVFALAAIGEGFLLVRASKRLLQFDELFNLILEPMRSYSDVLRRVTKSEGILHDHPEVLDFHRANMELLQRIDQAVISIQEARPKKKKKEELPRPEAV